MNHSKRTTWTLALLLAASLTPALAQQSENQPGELESKQPPIAEDTAPDTRWKASLICTIFRPSEVQRYNVSCTDATRLDVSVADCCIRGDHWETKSKNWDSRPNTAVTTSPGPANIFGVPSRVYNYGGTPENPRSINAEVDCSYLHGVDVFPASSFLTLTSDGTCTITDLGLRDAINRTP